MRSIEIGFTQSSRQQICRECHRIIPAREESVKITEIRKGAITSRKISYFCMQCHIGIRLKKGDELA